jgi:DNA modification methylase
MSRVRRLAEPPVAATPPTATVIHGDATRVLSDLPAGIAQTCVTSPPYWGLRDYGVAPRVWAGVGPPCRRHRWEAAGRASRDGHRCSRCGAWRGCLGLEPDPALFVEHVVSVMRAVRRVLRPDGTLWLNLGDSYALSAIRPEDGGPGAKPKDLLGIPWRVALALQADGWWLRSDVV